MLSTNRNKYQFSLKWAFGRWRAVKVEKPRERGRRVHKGGLGGPAVAVKPRAPRKVSPAQVIDNKFCSFMQEKKFVSAVF